MKKTILILFILLSLKSFSQITLDFECSMNPLWSLNLTANETKYSDYELFSYPQLNQFSLYNLDGTLYKTIYMPPKPDSAAFINYLWYISRTLFDNDPSNIEYLVEYRFDSIPNNYSYFRTKIIREDGEILFDEMNGTDGNIVMTEEGAKLILYYVYANVTYYNTKTYSLPGTLPSSTDEITQTPNSPLTIYPNPNNGSFYIQLRSNGGKEKIIDIYSPAGQLLDTYKSNSDMLHINQPGLPDGLYLVNDRTGAKYSSKRVIIKK
jgi:hypothetical protein